MFRSRGTVQSNTWVPLGTSKISRSMCLAMVARVARKPSPVMLRHTGYSSAMSSCMAVPASAGSAAAITSLMVTYQIPLVAASRGPADALDAVPVRPPPVALGHHQHLGGPADPERRVVVAQTPGRVRLLERRHLVEDLGVVLEGQEAVREALRNVQHPAVAGGQVDADVLAEGGRVQAQVDDHVVDRPVGAADQLGLLVRRPLPVHAPHGAPPPVQPDV